LLKSLIWWNLLEKRKPYREAFLYEKALKTDICAVSFALIVLFCFLQKRSDFHYGTARDFDFFNGKTENFRQKKWYASR
jgi:hypothetical protein